jgi:hypothetical protein
LRERRGKEFSEEYKCSINYHPGKAKDVADMLSKKVRIVKLRVQEVKLVEEVLSMDTDVDEEKISPRNLSVVPDLRKEIVELQLSSHEFRELREKEMKRRNHEFRVDNVRVMYYRDRWCVPNDKGLKKSNTEFGRYLVSSCIRLWK